MELYKENTADRESIKNNLLGLDFMPNIEAYIEDLDVYVDKIIQNAERIEYWDNDKLIGIAAFYANNQQTHEAFITMIGVSSDYNGQGIAKKLLERVVNHCKEIEFNRLLLEVRKDNKAAIGLYEKFGFSLFKEDDKTEIMSLDIVD